MSLVCVVYAHAKQDNQITVKVFPDHQGYINAGLSYGLAWETLSIAAENAGIKLIVEEDTWTRALNALKAKQVDAVFGAIKTEERSQWANFTAPLSPIYIHIFTSPNNPITKLGEIDKTKASIGVTKDSVHADIAKELGFEQIYHVVNRQASFNMLMVRRLDYLIYTDTSTAYHCLYTLKMASNRCLNTVDKDFGVNTLHMMTLKNDDVLEAKIAALNSEIANLHQQGKLLPLFNQFGYTAEEFEAFKQANE